jgi:hypothetical protein
MNKEGEYRNFEEEPEYDFKFDWAVGREFEHWITVDGGKLRIRTEITYFKLPEEGGQENKSNENNQI